MQELSQAAPETQSALEALGWVDITALAVIVVFLVLGIFKGVVWQISRLGTLVVAYVLSVMYGERLGEWMFHGSVQDADQQVHLYVAYVTIFVAVVVVLSLLALLLTRLVEKTGLTFYNRLGGGVLGVGTGALVALLILSVGLMFFPTSNVVAAARSSRLYDYSGRAVGWLDSHLVELPGWARDVFDLSPPEAPEGR
jgi:membrane protein required for colicin V production